LLRLDQFAKSGRPFAACDLQYLEVPAGGRSLGARE
jgi:hypothetical protein